MDFAIQLGIVQGCNQIRGDGSKDTKKKGKKLQKKVFAVYWL